MFVRDISNNCRRDFLKTDIGCNVLFCICGEDDIARNDVVITPTHQQCFFLVKNVNNSCDDNLGTLAELTFHAILTF